MDDFAQRSSEKLLAARQTPLLYIVDRDGAILFASATPPGEGASAALRETLRAAVAALHAEEPGPPLVFEGMLVRPQRLAAEDGAECFAVFLERFSEDTPAAGG